jgi:hypothetical protein
MNEAEEQPSRMITHWTEQPVQGPQWLIEGVIEKGSVVTMIGQPAAGKSFLALDMAAAIASGNPWNGHRTTKGGVVYIVGEGVSGFGRRLQALVKTGRLGKFDPLFLVTGGYSPFDQAANDRFMLELGELVAAPSIIMVDTLAAVFIGHDENKAADMSSFLFALRALCSVTGAALFLVHHSHRDYERARGSSALLGAIDTELFLKPTGDITEARMQKSKDGKLLPPFMFSLQEVDIGIRDNFDNTAASAVVNYQVADELTDSSREGGKMEKREEVKMTPKTRSCLNWLRVASAGGMYVAETSFASACASYGVSGDLYRTTVAFLKREKLIEFVGLTVRAVD